MHLIDFNLTDTCLHRKYQCSLCGQIPAAKELLPMDIFQSPPCECYYIWEPVVTVVGTKYHNYSCQQPTASGTNLSGPHANSITQPTN